jgi:uroporphyrinogen-III synthase
MTKSVLLTRSDLENVKLEQELQKCDYEILKCSLIKQELLDFDYKQLIHFTDIIITSFFMADAMPHSSTIASDMSVWVVGEKSSDILRKKGYKIMFCTESVNHLKQNIPSHIYKNAVYLSSDHITVDMPAECVRSILYKVTYRNFISNHAVMRYREGVDCILLYSENCAKTLMNLIKENYLKNYLANSTYIVISSKVERVVKRYFDKVVVCNNADAMLEYLKQENDKK